MAIVKAPDRSALAVRLKRQGLLPSTRDKYNEILGRANKRDLIGWINGRVHARTPIGTVLPMRAAVKHYLMAEEGYTEAELEQLLPKARGRSTKMRNALSPYQLALYHSAVDGMDDGPARTILNLLPRTGLRISEACGLSRDNIDSQNGMYFLTFRGKGDKERTVPLVGSALTVLDQHLQRHRPKRWLFGGYMGRPIGPHAVRKHTRKIAASHEGLAGLSPHVLRHTFATMALRNGMDLKRLQEILGHSSIKTTERYLHPSRSDLHDAMARLGVDEPKLIP